MTSAFAHLLPAANPAVSPTGDARHLAAALAEAVRGVGRTAPNPPVGAVVVKDGVVVGAGHHAKAGDRHGEIAALDDAASSHGAEVARGSTLYVTLEPCVHHGKTPPCVDRIIADGVARVVVGALDPNPVVHGNGVARLRAAGLVVDVADAPPDTLHAPGASPGAALRTLGARAAALVKPFARALLDKRVYTVLKIASSLDGRVAASTGASRWITGDESRALVHRLRDAVDVVVVGAGTVLADDPALTVRDVPGRDPARAVIDGRGRVPANARVHPARVFRADAKDGHAAVTPDRAAAGVDGRVDLAAVLRELAASGHTSALIEAGPGLATALLQAKLVDELWWMTAPVLIGGDGVPAVHGLGVTAPADGVRFELLHGAMLGVDGLVVLRPR